MEREGTALVLGATGGIGGKIAEALLRHGWRVRGMARNEATTRTAGQTGIEWIEGDAMRRDDVLRASEVVGFVATADWKHKEA